MTAETTELATLLHVKSKGGKKPTTLDIAEAVKKGLSVRALDDVCVLMASGEPSFRYRIIRKATLARRQRTAERRLSVEESNRVARLAQLWTLANEVWGSEKLAQQFLMKPHPLLENKIPRDVAADTDIGARVVEQLLGRLKYGVAI